MAPRKTFIGVQRFVLSTIPNYWKNFRHSRSVSKLATLHFLAGVIFAIQGILSIFFYLDMLDPSPYSLFFDFRGTSPNDTKLGYNYGCAVTPIGPLAIWRNAAAGIANYILLAWFVLCAGILASVLALASFLLFFAFRHFGKLPRSRFFRPRFLDLMCGRICKWCPFLLRYCSTCMGVFIAAPLILLLCFNICNSKLVEISRPVARIKNCRQWVSMCVKDNHRYGRHLACSLPENYLGFPAEPCAEDRHEACVFPRTHAGTAKFSKGAIGDDALQARNLADAVPQFVTVEGNICDGEMIPSAEGGPVPWCPMCTDARLSKGTGVYNRRFASDGRRREATTAGSASKSKTSSWKGRMLSRYYKTSSKPSDVTSKQQSLERSNSIDSNLVDEDYVDSNSFVELLEVPAVASKTSGGPDTSHYGQSIKRRKLLKLSHPEVVPVEQYPWFLAHDVSDAFYQAYVRTLRYFKEGSHMARMLNIWSLSSLCILGGYTFITHVFDRLLSPDGYFASPASTKIENTKWIMGTSVATLLNVVSFGKWRYKES